MRKAMPIEKETLTEEDYLRSRMFGGFSDEPIPQSEETKAWQKGFATAIKGMNAALNESAPSGVGSTEQGK